MAGAASAAQGRQAQEWAAVWTKVLQTIGGILLGVIAYFTVRLVSQLDTVATKVDANTQRIIRIEASGVTVKEALELWKEIGDIKKDVNGLASPGEATKDALLRIERKQEALAQRLQNVEREVARLEGR